jgi:putative nucleotidyltransferase with HDIG domain
MKMKVNQTIQNLPDFSKYLLLIATVILISFLFPNNARFQYEYQKDQTWRYNDLYAPFDFPIEKTSEELEVEKSRIQENFSPVYQKYPAISDQKIGQFLEDINTQVLLAHSDLTLTHFRNNAQTYAAVGTNLIEQAYQRGVIRLDSTHLSKQDRFVIQVREGGNLTPYTLQSVKTVDQALEIIRKELISTSLPDAGVLIPLLEPLIVPNITFDATFSNQLLEAEIGKISPSKGVVQKAELIINRDGIVTDDIYLKLNSFKIHYEQEITKDKSYWGVFLGYLLLSSLIIGAFFIFLRFNAPQIFNRFFSLLFLLLLILVFSYLVYLIDPIDELSTYIIPFCIVPIVLKNFFSERVALFTHLIIVLIASFLTSLGYEFTFLTLLAGIIATVTISETRDWGQFFKSILFIFLTYTIGFVGLSLIRDGQISNVEYRTISWLLLNSVLIMLSYPLIPLLGRIFGYISSISLIELADMNRPLLKELSLKTPGTMQHSLQVANLAEAAADKIGANALLVKVGALYHDIGKMKNPQFFVENQQNSVNPHDQIGEKESAGIIIGHVTEGLKMAEKARLPKVLIDFIASHHGTTRTEYFFRNYKTKHPDEDVDSSVFTYPGPKPKTKEEAIMMLADSLEAASKSMKQPTPESIRKLVADVTQYKIEAEQFSDSDLTFSEIEQCKEVFEGMLISIYQPRIEYPK